MKYEQGVVYHIFNQGNNQEEIFFNGENYLFFLRKVRKYILPYADILCYCLMPNHFHFLLVPNEQASLPGTAVKPQLKWGAEQLENSTKKLTTTNRQERLSQAIGTMLSSYTKAINRQQERTGSLFRAKTKVKDGWINGAITLKGPNRHLFFRGDNDYARQCFKYIHQNPVKANLVAKPTDWLYSSAKDYAGLRNGTLCNKTLASALALI